MVTSVHRSGAVAAGGDGQTAHAVTVAAGRGVRMGPRAVEKGQSAAMAQNDSGCEWN